MKFIVLLFSLTVFSSYACNDEVNGDFRPFAELIERQGTHVIYELFFPFHDHKEKANYLSNILVSSPELFSVSISYSESDRFEGYYSASLQLTEKILNNTYISAAYNCSNKLATECSISFCLNPKDSYTIEVLLKNATNV